MVGFSLSWARLLLVCGAISAPFAVILLAVCESRGFDFSSLVIAIVWLSGLVLACHLWRLMRIGVATGLFSESDFYNNPSKVVATFVPTLVVWLLVTLVLVFGVTLWALRDHL